jgi:acylphosphatase
MNAMAPLLSGAPSARRYVVSGRVQGVGFRYFVEKNAARIGVTGWVRNLDDGGVEVHAQGSAAQLTELEGLLREGPRWAEVRGVEVIEAAMLEYKSFRIHP